MSITGRGPETSGVHVQLKAKAALVAAACVAAGAAVIAPATPALAAAPLCTTRASILVPNGYYLVVPTTGSHSPNCYLAKGSISSAVSALQVGLNCLGSAITVDGNFGAQTRNAVLAIQKRYGITQDGIYGSQTRGVMWFSDTGLPPHCAPSS
jgi:hypothetical protein